MHPKHYDEYNKRIGEQNTAHQLGEDAITIDECEGQVCKGKVVSNIVKRVDTLDQSEYLRTKFLNKKCLPTVNSKKHYPVPINGGTNCNSHILTDGNYVTSDNTAYDVIGLEKGNCQ